MDIWNLGEQDFGNQFEATEIELLEKSISKNPRIFAEYEKLFLSYQKSGEIEKLREKRMEMAKYLLISPNTWKEWLSEELLAEEYELYEQFFELSVQQYSTPDIWLERLRRMNKMIIDDDGDIDEDAVEVAREMCELAVKACGHFSVGGSDMWQMYRNLENTILSKCLTVIDEGEEMDDTEDNVPEEAKEQFKKVKQLYSRQFEMPLINLAATYDEFNEWHTLSYGVVSHEFKETYTKTWKYVRSIQEHEAAILEAKKESIEEARELWIQYISQQIKKKTEIPRVQSLFERAVIDCCDEPGDLWTRYAEYAIRFNVINRAQVCERSVKRHPDSGKLWAYFLTADAKNTKRVLEIWDTATSCKPTGEGALELCIALLTYFRESEPAKIKEAVEKSEKLLEEESDNIRASFYQFWGQTACVFLKDSAATRQAFEKFRRHSEKHATHWLQSVDALILVNDIAGARSLFRQSHRLLSAEDGFFELTNRWLLFERLHGGKEEFFDAKDKIAAQKVKVEAEVERKKSMMKGKSKKRRLEEAALNAKKKAKLNSGMPSKRADTNQDTAEKAPMQTDDVPPGFADADAPPGFNEDNAPPGFSEEAPPGFDDAPPGFTEDKAEPMEEEKAEADPEETKMQTRTIFVLNIPKALRYEQELEKMCREYGEVKSVRCPRGQKGKFLKGFGYVEFATPDEATKALQGLKGKNLGKKALRIEKYRKAATSGHTLFIKGIKKLKNPSFQLKKLFESCGNIVEIRIPLDNTQRNKGFAYMEFDKAKGVEEALKIEDPTIEGYTLGVQKCKDKKKAKKDLPKQFVPRTLNNKKKKALGGSQNEGKPTLKEDTTEPVKPSSSKEPSKTNLSNSDFRKFLSK